MAPRTGKVDYWMNSNQRQRWVATSIAGHRTGAGKDPPRRSRELTRLCSPELTHP